MAWEHYSKLMVWQDAMNLVDEVYRLIACLPWEERYALATQMRRSVVSIPSNIAEGHGRRSDKEFQRFLNIARGSVFELETQLMICVQQKYLTKEQTANVLEECGNLSRMLVRLGQSFDDNR